MRDYTSPKRITSMTTKRREYTQEFKLEAISLVVDQKRKIAEVAESLGIGVSTLDNRVSKHKKEKQVQHYRWLITPELSQMPSYLTLIKVRITTVRRSLNPWLVMRVL